MSRNKIIFFGDNRNVGINDDLLPFVPSVATFDSTLITFDSTLITFDSE